MMMMSYSVAPSLSLFVCLGRLALKEAVHLQNVVWTNFGESR